MPKVNQSPEAAIRACVALLEVFDPDRSANERRELVQAAVDAAMEATGIPPKDRPDAALICDSWELTRDATES